MARRSYNKPAPIDYFPKDPDNARGSVTGARRSRASLDNLKPREPLRTNEAVFQLRLESLLIETLDEYRRGKAVRRMSRGRMKLMVPSRNQVITEILAHHFGKEPADFAITPESVILEFQRLTETGVPV